MEASGSGKSTLLRLINRLSEIDSGIILLNGNDIRTYVPMELRRKIGMVFQVPVIFKGIVRVLHYSMDSFFTKAAQLREDMD